MRDLSLISGLVLFIGTLRENWEQLLLSLVKYSVNFWWLGSQPALKSVTTCFQPPPLQGEEGARRRIVGSESL